MKHILIIDETQLFREFLRLKLEDYGMEVSVGIGAMDGISKMRTAVPDLVILDYHLARQGFAEVLREKKNNPNTVQVPVIVLAQSIEQKQLIALLPYNVKKVFYKPVKIDALFLTVSELLGVPFAMDETPSIVEAHVNDSIIFIEIAQGLNRDKLDLLRFKILELINLYEIRVPKVILMLSDIKLGFGDTPNLRRLLDTIIQASRTKLRYIRVLTLDDFVRNFIQGKKDYSDIEVVSNLQFAVDGLLVAVDTGPEQSARKAEIIGERILKATAAENKGAMALKFDAETKSAAAQLMKDSIRGLRVAVIDDDFVTRELIENTFLRAGAAVDCFPGGKEFLELAGAVEYHLVFLDINMPNMDGFEVLRAFRYRNINYPVIIISGIIQRETMIKAFQLGVKSYLIKPLKSEDILRKTVEILKANF